MARTQKMFVSCHDNIMKFLAAIFIIKSHQAAKSRKAFLLVSCDMSLIIFQSQYSSNCIPQTIKSRFPYLRYFNEHFLSAFYFVPSSSGVFESVQRKKTDKIFSVKRIHPYRIYDKTIKRLSRLAEATERAGFVPQYWGINKQRCHRRSLQRDARGTSPSSSMAQRLAQSRFRRTGPSFCVSRRARKCQRQRHRVHPGATLLRDTIFKPPNIYVNKINTFQLCLRESNKHKCVLVRTVN